MVTQVMEYIKDFFGAEPEFLFESSPDTAVFRESGRKKWFGVIMGNLPAERVGLPSGERIVILNLKCDPLLASGLVDHQRIFRGYHMNKEHWISVLLDGSVSMEELAPLIEMSYDLVHKRTGS